MRSRSDSEPTTMPTSGLDMRDCRRDVFPILRAVEGDFPDSVVRAIARVRDGRPERRDVEDPTSVRYQAVALQRGSGVEHERAGRLGILDALDRRPDVAARR